MCQANANPNPKARSDEFTSIPLSILRTSKDVSDLRVSRSRGDQASSQGKVSALCLL